MWNQQNLKNRKTREVRKDDSQASTDGNDTLQDGERRRGAVRGENDKHHPPNLPEGNTMENLRHMRLSERSQS